MRVTKLGVDLRLKVGSEYCSPLRHGELGRNRQIKGVKCLGEVETPLGARGGLRVVPEGYSQQGGAGEPFCR